VHDVSQLEKQQRSRPYATESNVMMMKATSIRSLTAISNHLPIAIALITSTWLCACNSSGGGSGTGGNTPPTVNAGADQTATAGASIQLSGSGSDTEGGVSYHWEQTGGPTVTLSDNNTANPTFVVPTVASTTTFIFLLTVTDNGGATSTDEVSIIVNGTSSGGGGTASNRRLSRVLYDLDNNGTVDGVTEFSYDNDGRVIQETYTYTADGTADTDFKSFSIGAPAYNQTVTYTYNGAGLLTTLSTTDPSGRTDMVYDYGADTLVDQLTLEIYNTSGALTEQDNFNLTYNAGQLTAWDFRLGDNTMIQSDALTYNASSQVQSDVLTQAMGGSQALSEYTYNTAGMIASIHKTKPSSTSYFINVDFEYDAFGLLSARVATGNKFDDKYRWDYTYGDNDELQTKAIDLGSNGTPEATVTAEWEDGACRTVFLWAPRAEPNFVANAALPYAPASGYAVIPVCGGT